MFLMGITITFECFDFKNMFGMLVGTHDMYVNFKYQGKGLKFKVTMKIMFYLDYFKDLLPAFT